MSQRQRSICLIGPGHVASTPRLVKEADALVEAGYLVHVVVGRNFAPIDALDACILRTAPWGYERVDYRAGLAVTFRKVLRRFARRLVTQPAFATPQIAARAHHAETHRLAAVAAQQGADLYWGHCLAGLSIAAIAAQASGAKWGFDAEDFHEGETEEGLTDPTERTLRSVVLRAFLPGCSGMTASSPLIAARYAEIYRIPVPETVLNVFPLAQAPASPLVPSAVSASRPARCYWFSQTIGTGRGLESMVAILSHMRTPVELHLRGHPVAGYTARLQALAQTAANVLKIHVHPSGAPTEMARLAAGFDLGLSIEESTPVNHDLCLANKIFVYLLAGIPQFLSTTRGQAGIAPQLGAAALLGDLRQPQESARRLDEFFSSPDRILQARAAAWTLARERFCWDVEKQRFLRVIAHAFE